MNIKIIEEYEIEQTSKMIENAVRFSQFAKFYPQCSLDYVVESLDYEGIKKRMTWTHFYVLKDEDKVIGCGAIGPYWDSETESCLFSIFVDSDYQGRGLGKMIVKVLEQDEFFKRAKRIEVPASMSVIPFYRKLGYEHKNGELIYEDGHFALEKFNNKNISPM